MLYENNIVFIQLDSSISATDGASLGEDQTYYFTTTYNPLYASIRQVRLDLGPFITDLPDDTVNLAIFEAGREADAFSFQSTLSDASFFTFARHKYTLYLAELILLEAIMGDGTSAGKFSKTLGDLSVSRGGNFNALARRAEDIRAQLREWLKGIQSGGDVTPGTSMRPGVSVKGQTSEDFFVVDRQWEPTSAPGVTNYTPASNNVRYASLKRDVKTYRRRS